MKYDKVTPKNKNYPGILREISSPPKQLYIKGELKDNRPLVAIVGSRKATRYGRAVTEQLAGELAGAGIGIVSGLALGVDAVAHRAALDAGGYTLAVLGCGIDNIYPATNRDLGEKILKSGGAIISEYPPGTPPLKQHFPARNRIVAGLAQAIVVTEAAERSGALITATFALESGREVMAVPGNINSPMSAGANGLIKSGATAVTDASDVMAALGLESEDKARTLPLMSAEEAAIYTLLEEGVTDGQDIQVRSGMDTATFNQTITLMEIGGKVRNLGGGKWIKM